VRIKLRKNTVLIELFEKFNSNYIQVFKLFCNIQMYSQKLYDIIFINIFQIRQSLIDIQYTMTNRVVNH